MHRSQPFDPRILSKLGIREETEEEKAAGQQVVKIEIVENMFDFHDVKITLPKRLRYIFLRIKNRCIDAKWSIKNFFVWRRLVGKYRPWDIHNFLLMFHKHLELYIAGEKQFGYAKKEFKNYKISSAQEAADIIQRLLDDAYATAYIDAVEKKWGKFPYEKTTYANGSTGFKHLTPEEYDKAMQDAHKQAAQDEENDLTRLGVIIKNDMLNWWN